MEWRARIHQWLSDLGHEPTLGQRAVATLILACIAMQAVAVVVATLPDLTREQLHISMLVRSATAIIFIGEYILRVWTAPEHSADASHAFAQRRKYVRSFMGAIDLLVILPFSWDRLAVIDPKWTLVLDMLVLFKLARYVPGLRLMAAVVRRESRALVAALAVLLVLLTIASTWMYVLEHDAQPEIFSSIPASLWWGIVTMGTIGYGDMVPATAAGKILGSCVIVLGIATFAIPAGLFASGFGEEMRKREFIVTWQTIQRMPLFAQLDAGRIAHIARLLTPQMVPANSVIVRRGEHADAMFFIMAGEVEIDVTPHPVRLKAGQYFGELALLRSHSLRSATVTAISECRLLALESADFQNMMDENPDLRKSVTEVAERREQANAAAIAASIHKPV